VAEDPNSECATPKEIEEQSKNAEAFLLYRSKYFDSNEFENDPVKLHTNLKTLGFVHDLT